jgi:hypothetical protein
MAVNKAAQQAEANSIASKIRSMPSMSTTYSRVNFTTASASQWQSFQKTTPTKTPVDPNIARFASENYTSTTAAYDKKMRVAMNITSDGNDIYSESASFKNFDRYYTAYPAIAVQTPRQYVFFVRPSLNLYGTNGYLTESCRRDPFIDMMNDQHKDIVQQLTIGSNSNHQFINWLVGRMESIQIPDYALASTGSIVQPFTGYTIKYGTNTIPSTTGREFDCSFREDKFLSVHKFFQLWIHYIDGVTRNKIKPAQEFIDQYRFDYATSVYYFLCDPSAEKILWYAKYTGVFPTSTPNSDFSFNKGGSTDTSLSISFESSFFESLNPSILMD